MRRGLGSFWGQMGAMTLALLQFTRGEDGGRVFEQKRQRVPGAMRMDS